MQKATIRPYQASAVYSSKSSVSTIMRAAQSTCHYIEVARYREYSVTRIQEVHAVTDQYLTFLFNKINSVPFLSFSFSNRR